MKLLSDEQEKKVTKGINLANVKALFIFATNVPFYRSSIVVYRNSYILYDHNNSCK